MTMKMLTQVKCSSSQPPTIGPIAMATPPIAPHKPMARARSPRSVKTLEMSDSVAGNVIAAPSPITARAAMSCGAVVVNPPASDAAPTTASPASSMPLRPNRSDKAAERQQQRGEHQVVGIDDPLELGWWWRADRAPGRAARR